MSGTTEQVFEIPLSGSPQIFTIPLAGTTYTLTFTYRVASANNPLGWVLDIGDTNNNPILTGVPLVTGCDLLEQFATLGISGKLVCQTDGDTWAPPTFNNLGTTSHLYFVTP